MDPAPRDYPTPPPLPSLGEVADEFEPGVVRLVEQPGLVFAGVGLIRTSARIEEVSLSYTFGAAPRRSEGNAVSGADSDSGGHDRNADDQPRAGLSWALQLQRWSRHLEDRLLQDLVTTTFEDRAGSFCSMDVLLAERMTRLSADANGVHLSTPPVLHELTAPMTTPVSCIIDQQPVAGVHIEMLGYAGRAFRQGDRLVTVVLPQDLLARIDLRFETQVATS